MQLPTGNEVLGSPATQCTLQVKRAFCSFRSSLNLSFNLMLTHRRAGSADLLVQYRLLGMPGEAVQPWDGLKIIPWQILSA